MMARRRAPRKPSRSVSRARFSFVALFDGCWTFALSRLVRVEELLSSATRECRQHLSFPNLIARESGVFLIFRKTNHCNSHALGKISALITANEPLIRYRERIGPMTKNELIAAVADKAQMTKTAASAAVDATFDAITATLKKGGEVKIMGFGNFRVVKRAAREGRDPRTGAPVKIKAAKRPRFSAGKGLKEAVNR
jgi:DNA-binding protein HU-beta